MPMMRELVDRLASSSRRRGRRAAAEPAAAAAGRRPASRRRASPSSRPRFSASSSVSVTVSSGFLRGEDVAELVRAGHGGVVDLEDDLAGLELGPLGRRAGR